MTQHDITAIPISISTKEKLIKLKSALKNRKGRAVSYDETVLYLLRDV
jgi:hypothetical protein